MPLWLSWLLYIMYIHPSMIILCLRSCCQNVNQLSIISMLGMNLYDCHVYLWLLCITPSNSGWISQQLGNWHSKKHRLNSWTCPKLITYHKRENKLGPDSHVSPISILGSMLLWDEYTSVDGRSGGTAPYLDGSSQHPQPHPDILARSYVMSLHQVLVSLWGHMSHIWMSLMELDLGYFNHLSKLV